MDISQSLLVGVSAPVARHLLIDEVNDVNLERGMRLRPVRARAIVAAQGVDYLNIHESSVIELVSFDSSVG